MNSITTPQIATVLVVVFATALVPSTSEATVVSEARGIFAMEIVEFKSFASGAIIPKPSGLLISGELYIHVGSNGILNSSVQPDDPLNVDSGDVFGVDVMTAVSASKPPASLTSAVANADVIMNFDASSLTEDVLISWDVTYSLLTDVSLSGPGYERGLAESNFFFKREQGLDRTVFLAEYAESGARPPGAVELDENVTGSMTVDTLIPAGSTNVVLYVQSYSGVLAKTVPEPTSAIFLCGSGALILLRRRHRVSPRQ